MFGHRSPGSSKPSAYNFTDHVRKILMAAREEAARLGHEYVGTEHLLLALVRERAGVGEAVLENLCGDPDELRHNVEARIKRGNAAFTGHPNLPYTSRAKKVLELAMTQARELNHSYVGTEHLLLGLVREEKGIAAQVLRDAGVTPANARAETVRLLGEEREPRSRFTIAIDDSFSRSIYEQIIDQIREAVATRRLKPEERLPTVRQLADQLDIAPGTVARAYRELERLGIVVTEGARGTRVAARTDAGLPEAERPEALAGLMRPVVVAAFHLGASAAELRAALEQAMRGIFSRERGDESEHRDPGEHHAGPEAPPPA
ncbi:MAG TPA: Clp protease N-terminal domain-containing protein [Gemmatimonadaceae bacterium]|nr:Clp protease N-terminal domain-containing protein [Gemmatimonadaceae bacterium]